MITSSPSLAKPDLTLALAELRRDLIDRAFVLDRQGQCEAADVAMTVAAQLAELLPLKTEAGA